MPTLNELLFVTSLILISFSIAFVLAYSILFRHFKRMNKILIDRSIEDMQIYINTNSRVKILERRLLKIISAFKDEKKRKREILNCLNNN